MSHRPSWEIALFCICGALASAAGAAGRFQFVSGEVRVSAPDGTTRHARKGEEVREGELLMTGKASSAQLVMDDGALIALRPHSSLRIDRYRYSGRQDGSEKSVLSLLKGVFRTLTGAIGRVNQANYLVRTPTATIGIRGTDHEPAYIPPQGWEGAPGAEPGSYDKVNAGATFLEAGGTRIELGTNQIGFAPVTGDTRPRRLERVPGFLRASEPPRARETGGQRQGAGEADTEGSGGGGRGRANGIPAGGREAAAGCADCPAVSVPAAAAAPVLPRTAGSGGASFGVGAGFGSGLAAAPVGMVVAGGGEPGCPDCSGAGVVGTGTTGTFVVLMDPASRPAFVADSGGFSYARGDAPLLDSGAATLPDGTVIGWGIYAGGVVVEETGVAHVPALFPWMGGGLETPPSAYAAMGASPVAYAAFAYTPPINEAGLRGGSVSLNATVNFSTAQLTAYDLRVVDASSREFAGSLAAPASLSGFVSGLAGPNLRTCAGAGCTPGPTITATHFGYAQGALVGTSAAGMVSAYTLNAGGAMVTGAVLGKR
ncbi:MAG: hypothetical protein OHK0026_14270 [Rhodocyclaceae bacterium]